MSKGNTLKSEEKVYQNKTEVFKTAKLVQPVPLALFKPEVEVKPFYTPATQMSKAPFQTNVSISSFRYPSYLRSDDQMGSYPAHNSVADTKPSHPSGNATTNSDDSRNVSVSYHMPVSRAGPQISNKVVEPLFTELPERSNSEPSITHPQPPPPPPPQLNFSDSPAKKTVGAAPAGKANLLEEIRRRGGVDGAGLHKVADSAGADRSPQEKDDLFGALHHALNVIQQANRMSDDSEEDTDIDSNGSWSEEDC
jgi:hypothetical protein